MNEFEFMLRGVIITISVNDGTVTTIETYNIVVNDIPVFSGDFTSTATEDVVVTQAGPSSEEIFDVTYIANIDALTEAGDYSTVMTFTATANF